MTSFDPNGKYKDVKCPLCNSASKMKLMSTVSASGTRNKQNNFSYRAGENMEKAKADRRVAEALSHVGGSPYSTIDDTPMDEGIHDNESPIKL